MLKHRIWLKKIIFSIILILILATTTKANNNEETKEYNLQDIGMKISLNSNLIDVVSGLKNKDERLSKIENQEEYLKSYENSGILLNAVDNVENTKKEIIVAQRTNTNYINMKDFNKISEKQRNKYKEKMLKTFKQQANQTYDESQKTKINIKDSSLITTNNQNNYIHVTAILQNEEKSLEMSIYYTIMNGRLITISFRYYNNNSETNSEEKEIIENTEFYEVTRPQDATNQTMSLVLGTMAILIIILTIIIIAIRIKDRKRLDKNIKDRKVKEYGKFGGLILFFWTLCFYQILLRIIGISNTSNINNINFYINAVKLQTTIIVLINMYQIYITLKRKQETPKKIIISNIIIMITGLIITIIRIIYAKINPNDFYDLEYFKQELSVLVYSVIYPILCIIYFAFSKRVQTYYYLPSKSYKETWRDVINKLKRSKDEKKE